MSVFTGKVRVYLVNQDTGEETPQPDCWLADMFPSEWPDDGPRNAEYLEAMAGIQRDGRWYVGGGARPLFLLFPAREVTP